MSRVRTAAERLLEEAVTTLTRADVPSPEVDAELLLAHVMGLPRAMLRSRAKPQEPQRRAYLLCRLHIANASAGYVRGRYYDTTVVLSSELGAERAEYRKITGC